MNYIHGEHNFQFGARPPLPPHLAAERQRGRERKSDVPTAIHRAARAQCAEPTGAAGQYRQRFRGLPAGAADQRYHQRATHDSLSLHAILPYFEDTWKVTRNLTLNYGISWFLATIPTPQGIYLTGRMASTSRTGLLDLCSSGPGRSADSSRLDSTTSRRGSASPGSRTSSKHRYPRRRGYSISPTILLSSCRLGVLGAALHHGHHRQQPIHSAPCHRIAGNNIFPTASLAAAHL